jgi:hypothetical protein
LAGLDSNYFEGPADVIDLATLRTAQGPRNVEKSLSHASSVIPFSNRRKFD